MSIWPTKFVQNDSDVKGIGVLPIIWVMGEKEVGKSTFVATIDPVRPKQKTRTRITDLEMSYNTLHTQAPMQIDDIRQMTFDRVGKEYTFKHLFETWRECVLSVKAGEYTVLGVDPVSDLFQGAFMWVGDNAHLFGKTPQRYSGQMGTMAQWGDTALYWKQLSLELAQRYETTVFVSHLKDLYKNNVRTGQKGARGHDFTEVASLVLWLGRKGNDFEATVLKSRLSWWDWGEDNTRNRPILRDLLPRRLVPEYSGQSYPELIATYMANPQADYGELNIVEEDPTVEKMTEQERLETELQLAESKKTITVAEGRKAMVQRLIDNGYYTSSKDVSEVAKEHNINYTIETEDEVYKQLANIGSDINRGE